MTCIFFAAFDRPAAIYGSGTTAGTTGVPTATAKPLGRLVENVANDDARHCRDPVKSQKMGKSWDTNLVKSEWLKSIQCPGMHV